MVKINDIRHKTLIKEYIDITVNGEEYCVYMCNDVVRGIYRYNEEGFTENIGNKALTELSGLSKKGFKKLMEQWSKEHIYEELATL